MQITRTDGRVVNYQTVPAQELKRYSSGNYCARIGSTLKFNKPFVSTDAEIGGTLTVPAYTFAPHLSKATSIVPVDDPNWLVAQTAADWVQSDITLAQNQPALLAAANDLMTGMIKANGSQLNTVPMAPFPTIRDW